MHVINPYNNQVRETIILPQKLRENPIVMTELRSEPETCQFKLHHLLNVNTETGVKGWIKFVHSAKSMTMQAGINIFAIRVESVSLVYSKSS